MPRISLGRRAGEPFECFPELHSVSEIEFAGYWITEAPIFGDILSLALPRNARIFVVFCLVVLIWGLVHGGDWGTAYTAGAFFVALVGYASKSLH